MLNGFNTLLALSLLSGCATLSTGPQYEIFEIENPPEVGRTKDGRTIRLGGLSGLWVTAQNGHHIQALAVTDRGPNGEKNGSIRPFLLPEFHPRLVKLDIDLRRKTAVVIREIPLRNGERNFSGLPLPDLNDDREMEIAVGWAGEKLPVDPQGIDPESLCEAKDKSLWIGEEYGPDLLHFSADGSLIRRYTPGDGLPKWLKQRKANGGFEGVACSDDFVFAVLQSPFSMGKPTVPIIQFDPRQEKVVAEFSYPLESFDHKVGDMYAARDGRFFVIEQNGKSGADAFQRIFEFSLGPTVSKREVLDLVRAGYQVDKAEGLVHLGRYILVISDNDFNLSPTSQKTKIGFFEINFSTPEHATK